MRQYNLLFEDYITVREAARELGVHPETVKRVIREGHLPAIKIRNMWFIKRDTFDVFRGTYIPRRGKPPKKLL